MERGEPAGRIGRCIGAAGVAAAVATLAAGCADPGYQHDGGRAPVAAISSRQMWRAAGDLARPADAIDGSGATAAVTNGSYANARFILDLGKPCLFDMVVIDHGSGDGQYGFCEQVAVLTSLDGREYTHQTAVAGTRRVTLALLQKPTLARFVLLQAVMPSARPWSIAEVYLE